jgi:adenylosuccinate synthase
MIVGKRMSEWPSRRGRGRGGIGQGRNDKKRRKARRGRKIKKKKKTKTKTKKNKKKAREELKLNSTQLGRKKILNGQSNMIRWPRASEPITDRIGQVKIASRTRCKGG